MQNVVITAPDVVTGVVPSNPGMRPMTVMRGNLHAISRAQGDDLYNSGGMSLSSYHISLINSSLINSSLINSSLINSSLINCPQLP